MAECGSACDSWTLATISSHGFTFKRFSQGWPHSNMSRDDGYFPLCARRNIITTPVEHRSSLAGCSSPVVKVSDHDRHVMSSSPVPLKTLRIGKRCTLNLLRVQTSFRWCGVVARRGWCQLRGRPFHLTMIQNYESWPLYVEFVKELRLKRPPVGIWVKVISESCQIECRSRHLTMVQNYEVLRRLTLCTFKVRRCLTCDSHSKD
ncbi:uncharacterized protein TNCV_2086841 [Trichonephila clavipes]|nr:uncharacterized protein TNCV_2086841 [Trichonephila clavipes]